MNERDDVEAFRNDENKVIDYLQKIYEKGESPCQKKQRF